MNIAYKGNFLKEGLRTASHNFYNLSLQNGETLDEAIKSLPGPVDLAVLEMFGPASDIQALTPCETPVALFCVDTPLNEFWLRPLLKNADYVFVDQPQCVPSLACSGIRAEWLPLPARSFYFQPRREKKYDLTFVGATNSMRLKRNNLLKLIQSQFKINIMSGLSISQTQDVFSRSKIILNENFFPGLTLRVLQGLSAGSAVMSELSPYGADFGLENNRDLVLYNPADSLDAIAGLLDNSGQREEIAIRGQEKCRKLYSSQKVALDLLANTGYANRGRICADEDYAWNKINAELLFAQRFGGNISAAMKSLEAVANSSSPNAAAAHTLIGDMQVRFKGGARALEHYTAALDIDPGGLANLKLALLLIQRDDMDGALKRLVTYLKHSSHDSGNSSLKVLTREKDRGSALLLAAADIYFNLGKLWDMGFHKDFADPAPDTAFSAAAMAWRRHPSALALEVMLACLRPYGCQGELLPRMLKGMEMGLLPDSLRLKAARAAYGYYDAETALAFLP